MNTASFTSIVRLAVALIVTSVFLAMPIAEASRSGEPTIEACDSDHAEDRGSVTAQDDTSQDQHDHHAHKCGTCHVHLVTRFQSLALAVVETHLTLQIGKAGRLIPGIPDPLHRPPRSFN